MPGEKFVINVVMTGVPQAEAGAAKVTAATREMGVAAKGASASGVAASTTLADKWTGAGNKVTAAGKRLNRGLTLPILAIGAVSGKMAVDFEKSMRNVNSIAQLPEKQFQKLNKEVLAMAGPTAQAPKTLAEGLYDLVSSGFDANESITVLNASARAATAGLTTTEVSTKAVAAALNAYHRPASDAKAISDDLFQTVNLGVVTFDELASTIGYVLPAANTMGVDLKQVGASISTLTKQGQSGSNAVTNINAALTAFIKPSKDMSKLLDELGYKTSQQLISQKGFQGALELVTKAVHGNKEAIGKLFPNVRAMRAVFGLTGSAAKTAGEDLRGFQHDTGATGKVLKEQSKSIAYQWNQLKAEASVLGIELGKKLVPVMRSLAKDVAGILRGFSKLPDGVQDTTIKMLAFGAVMGPLLTIGGTFAKVIGGIVKGFQFIAGTSLVGDLVAALSMKGERLAALKMVGGDMASGIASGLTRFAPWAAAGAGVVNILSSVIGGDSKGALEKTGGAAGGALIGGILGSVIPGAGTVAGALVGGGIGSFIGPVIGGLFESGKKLTPMQERLQESSKGLTEAMKKERAAAQNLAHSNRALHGAKQRQKTATQGVRQAEQHLNQVLKQHRHNTLPVLKAELELAQAKHRNAKATREVRQAERLQGYERKIQMPILRTSMLEARHRINVLKDERQQLRNQAKQMVENGSTEKERVAWMKRMRTNSEQLGTAEKKKNEILVDANRLIGPKFAKALENASKRQLEVANRAQNAGETVKHYYKQMGEAVFGFSGKWRKGAFSAKESTDKLKNTLGPFRTEANRQMGKASGDVQSFANTSRTAFGQVQTYSNTTLTALGAKTINFGLTGGGRQKRATGGLVRIPGSGKQDTVPLNVMGVPVMAAPGEDIAFVTQHQRSDLDYAVAAAFGDRSLGHFFKRRNRPHYMARGGIIEPRMSGPDPMQEAGQHAIHRVTEAARAYIRRIGGDKSYRALVHEGNRMDALKQPYLWGGGHGSTPSRNGPWDCSGGTTELFYGAGWKELSPMVSSGFESFGKPGKGKVSVLANAEHVYTVLGSRAIGTSGENPGGGFGWINGYTYRPGFTVRHVDLMGEDMPTRPVRGKGQKPKRGFAKGGWAKVGYTTYDIDGPGASGRLMQGHGYAELGTGGANAGGNYLAKALGRSGELPMGFPLEVKIGSIGKVGRLVKLDRGSGQGSPFYAIDIHHLAWPDVGLHGNSKGVAFVRETGGGGSGGHSVPKTAGWKVAGGATSHGGGTYAPGGGQVSTAKLGDFGSVPDSLPGVRKELGQRRSELAQYRIAYHRAKDRQVRAALKVNIDLLLKRIAVLLKAQTRLIEQRHRKRVTTRIAKRGTFPDVEAALAGDEGSYNRIAEYASQVVDLEPSVLTPAYAGKEEGAYGQELGIEGIWRNHLIGGIATADARSAKLRAELKRIEHLKETDPKAFKQQRFRIKPLREALAAIAGTRSEWTEKLGEVQGLSGPSGIVPVLPTTPEAGSYGGYIFETQKAIQDLGLRLKEVQAGGDAGSSERLELLEQENALLKRERLVEQAQRPQIGAYLGAYKTGGTLPADGYYYGHKDETVVPADAGPLSEVHVHLNGREGVLEQLIDVMVEQRLTAAGHRIGLSKATPSAPGRRAVMTQGRRRHR